MIMIKEYIPVFAVAVAMLLLGLFLRSRGGRRGRHRRRRRGAVRLYRKLRGGQVREGAALRYLRCIDPFMFEELVLYAFSRCGYRVVRNERYTGDGGIDGRMRKGRRRYLLQMKRYSGYVDAVHVRDFAALCRRCRCGGAFVHTGRTGKAGRDEAEAEQGVSIVSGERLVRLLCRGEDPLGRRFWE